MLYTEVPDKLREEGTELKGDDHDSKMAIEYVHLYLGGEEIMNVLLDKNSEDINDLIKVIKLNIFNIKLDSKGKPQKDKDALILAGLESTDSSEKSLAILKTIYQVRCNTMHGSKNFIENQRLLLEPLTHILDTLVNLLYMKLSGNEL